MSVEFPLSRSAFLSQLHVSAVTFHIDRQRQNTGLGGGEILSAEIAPPLWVGSVTLANMRKRHAAGVEALLDMLDQPGRKFEAYKVQQIGPASDPLGTALEGHFPQLIEVDGVNPGQIRLNGLPSGFVLTSGDFLAFEYDNGHGPRRGLHRVVMGQTANSVGETEGFLMVTPAIREGAAIGAVVDLVRPHCLAVLVPGSVNYGSTSHNITSGMGFQFRQSLRV